MASKAVFNFSETFPGVVWNTLAVPGGEVLIVEIREVERRQATFFAINLKQGAFLWKGVSFDERWWIGLTAATPEVLFLHVFQNTDNPDEKSLLAWHIYEQRLLWRVDHFTFGNLTDTTINGTFTGKERALGSIEISSGRVMEKAASASVFVENIMLQKPFQYVDGNVHFETVKSFLTSRLNVIPVLGMEYLEYEHLIFVSYHVQNENLANYLVVFTDDGDLVLHEKLGDRLKGLGLDTFFILSGSLIFVRNRSELFSYRIV